MSANAKTIEVKVSQDGTVIVPAELTRRLALLPGQTVAIELAGTSLIVKPSRPNQLRRIRAILKEVLEGVSYDEIESAREDRCL